MSTCIQDLYDYDLVKNCCRCKSICLKSNFYKDRTKKDGYRPDCKVCEKKFYLNNRDRKKEFYYKNRDQLLNNMKNYNKQNREKINLYENTKRKSDPNFNLAHNIRVRINKAFKSQNVRKTNKTFDLLGCSHSFFKKWITHQLYGNMTLENYGENWCLDHCLPIASFNLLDENDVKKCFNWLNLRPMYCSENISKGDKIEYHYIFYKKSKQNILWN